MKIILAPKIGFCFGVKRAFNMSLEAFNKKPKPCQVLGPLVHNELVIKKLKKRGIRFIDSLNAAEKGTIIIPAHGEDPKVLEKIKKMGLEIIDTTCPLVKKVQDLAKNLQKKGYQVIIIGDKRHKEIKSIQATIKGKGIIIDNEKGFPKLKIKNKSVAVIVQTTQNLERVGKIIKKLKKKFENLKFYNTLCPTVLYYQKEVINLAKKVDSLLIVGSKTSANTKRLVEIAKTSGKPVYHIENPGQLRQKWFLGVRKLGIATGTSTPDWSIKDVIKQIESDF